MRKLTKQLFMWLIKYALGYDPDAVIADLTDDLSRAMGVPKAVADLKPKAIEICMPLMALSTSGEHKRHQALAAIIKAGASERDAALAIELVVREINPRP